jgi:Questin oxidase-like
LMPGCGAAAFHGLIRTAYAVESAHRAELAHALAYWASRWLDLGPQRDADPAGGARADPLPLLKAAAAVPGVAASPSGYIVERMHHAAAQPGFASAVSGLHLDGHTLPRLARHAAQLYARSGDFTVLHLVTSAWALRVLMPFVDELPAALAGYWQAYAAGAAGVSAKLKLTRAPTPLPWPQIVQKALSSDDEHLVKLVHACQQEQQAYGGSDDWQRAATRSVLSA